MRLWAKTLLLFSVFAYGFSVYAAPFGAVERRDRIVDSAAITAYRTAAVGLINLLKQKRNTPQEPALLMRLAETYHKAAGIEYRIAHGPAAAAKKGEVDLARYHLWLKQSVVPLTRMIDTYPTNKEIIRAYFLRAKTFKELRQREQAIGDLKYLIDHYPKSNPNWTAAELAASNLALYDLLVEGKDFRTAIAYLTRLNPQPGEAHYGIVLEKLAWASFYLNDIQGALAYLEKEIAYGRGRVLKTKAEIAERESAFANVALFYATGMESKRPDYLAVYNVNKAFPYFRSLESGPDLGKILVAFAYVLRSKGFDHDLEAFKNILVASPECPTEHSIEVVLVTMGNQLNKRRFAQLRESAAEVGKYLDTNKQFSKQDKLRAHIQKVFSETSDGLQTAFVKSRTPAPTPSANASPAPLQVAAPPAIPIDEWSLQIAHALGAVYHVMLKLPLEQPAREKLYYNLGEISFQVKEYEQATLYYRWIAEHGGSSTDIADDSRLKAISSRYETLRAKKVIPEQLNAVAFQKAQKTELPEHASEWLAWVQDADKDKGSKRHANVEVFVFESNRLLYAFGHVQEAVSRLIEFTKEAPSSNYAIPSAALAVDTYVLSEDWENANRLASGYLGFGNWKTAGFYKNLTEIYADTSYKMIEALYKRGEFAPALEKADSFLKSFPNSKYYKDCLALGGNAALALKDKARAMQYFAPIIGQGHTPEVMATALLTSAALAEDQYAFGRAAENYRKYLGMDLPPHTISPEERTALQRKTLLLTWLAGEGSVLKATLDNKLVCNKQTLNDCERIRAYILLSDRTKIALDDSLDRFRDASETNKIFWAAIAIANDHATHGLSFKDRTLLLSEISSTWAKLDPIFKYAMIPYISISIPESLRNARNKVQAMARLKADPAAIKKRTKLIEEMEVQLDKLQELPLTRIRVAAMNENAGLYMDFANELAKLPKLKGLSEEELAAYQATMDDIRSSFEKKGLELRKKAFVLASESAVNSDIMSQVSKAYFSEFPDEAKALTADRNGVSHSAVLSTVLLDEVDPANDTTKGVRQAWANAMQTQNWAKVSFLLNELKQKGLMSETTLAVARGISFVGVGAQAEAVIEIEQVIDKIKSDSRKPVLAALAAQYFNSYSKVKTRKYLEELADFDQLPALDRAFLSTAIQWSGATVSARFKEQLNNRSTASVPAGARGGGK